MRTWGPSSILLIVAVICFVLAVLKVAVSNLNLTDLGLAFGFGFIAAEDGKEYFFHRDGLDRSLDFDRLNGGEKVTFEVEASPRGPRASKVAAASG